MNGLTSEQVQLLLAMRQQRVHMDPRFTLPDFEKDPDRPYLTKRATRRLRPLKDANLVEMVDEADRYGVRLYRLTAAGDQALDEALAADVAATADPSGAVG